MKVKDFLLKHEEELKEYFERLKINHNKTEIKYGLSPVNVSLVFYITGEPDLSISAFKDKVEAMFNTDTDLTEVNNFIENLKMPYNFNNGTDFLKLKEDPLLHAFQVTVRKSKKTK